ncbi:MAG: hypothetical protein ACOX2A_01520 [Tepidanaerobacteraceae bacterium]|nr:DUF1858 domain-containing protein [Thermoanaerobacterales bacterium]
MKITNDILMKDLVVFHPEAYNILIQLGIKCLACDGMLNSTLQECAKHYDLDIDMVINELKKLEVPHVDKS